MKSHSCINSIVALTIAATMLGASDAVAQSPASEAGHQALPSWQELGFDDVPEGYPTDEIALVDGLNKSRGTWTFKGSHSSGDTATPVEGQMQIAGSFKSGMIPMWGLAVRWPAEKPEQVVAYNLLASPEKTGLELMLVRLGPTPPGGGSESQKTLFKGSWNLKNRTVTWTESSMKGMLPKQKAETKETPKPNESFAMVVAANGEITLQNPERAGKRQWVTGKTVARVGKPYVEQKLAPKNASYDTYAEVSDSRVKPCLPPGATDIVLRSERGGHFARYKVSGKTFDTFLNGLWEASKGTSAHQREQMHGEGEPVTPKRMVQRFEQLGWQPLKNAVIYHSPSKASGAMTTYYYDRDAGIAYHDTGYW